jgi:S-formylglutathione hydrolase FrmB
MIATFLVRSLIVLVVCASWTLPATGQEAASVSLATADDGLAVHAVTASYQAGTTQIRVLVPDKLDRKRRFPVVYVLPVEAGSESRYGDGLLEVKQQDLANKHGAIFVAPTFSHLPWYADHPTDPTIRQETYFLDVVVPFVEKTYPVLASRDGRLLLGFSKSGWGAWALLLRHPDVFGRAAAWDGPMMMDHSGPFGSADIFGTQENFKRYHISQRLHDRADALRGEGRLVLVGFSGFRQDHDRMHALLNELKIPHAYRAGPKRKHDWHSGWVNGAVELLVE